MICYAEREQQNDGKLLFCLGNMVKKRFEKGTMAQFRYLIFFLLWQYTLHMILNKTSNSS